jgi:hypothetical protein
MNFDNLYRKGVVRTFSGVYFNIAQPRPEDIFPIDIAVTLSRECRFNGATKRFYSVADHSVHCAVMAENMYPGRQALAFKCLMHDAPEYIWKDMPSPMKALLPDYQHFYQLTAEAVWKRFGINWTLEDRNIVNAIDKLALEFEWENKVVNWHGMKLPFEASEGIFLEHFRRLCTVPIVLSPTSKDIS